MPNRMNNDFLSCHFVEDEIGIRHGHDTTNGLPVCLRTDCRLTFDKIKNGLDAGLNAPGALGGRSVM